MFVLKHIHADGREDIIQSDNVRFDPGVPTWQSEDGKCGATGTPPTLWIAERGFVTQPLTGGTVFVMNENGKTVARYDLGASPVPIIGDGLTDPRPKGAVPQSSSLAA